MTGTTDRDAELAIARATAAQFQCYVIDVNGLGAGGVGRSCVIDPTSLILHQSQGQEDMFPIEVDLSMVRRQRETGMKGLGQVLKSFRDREVEFSVYDRTSGVDGFLNTLGPLEVPQQGSRAGLHVDVPMHGARPPVRAHLTTHPVDIHHQYGHAETTIPPVAGKTVSG